MADITKSNFAEGQLKAIVERIERLEEVHRDTILRLLTVAGARCIQVMAEQTHRQRPG